MRSGVKPMKKDEKDEARQSLRSRKCARDWAAAAEEAADDDDEDDEAGADTFTNDCIAGG